MIEQNKSQEQTIMLLRGENARLRRKIKSQNGFIQRKLKRFIDQQVQSEGGSKALQRAEALFGG